MGTMNISEINQRKLSLLDVNQLKAFLDIFKGVSNPKAKQIVKDLSLELRGRKTEEVEEASIKDIIKAVKFASKKIGGIVGDVMNDAEFQKAYAKYIDNPNDKNRLKKIQDYTNGMLGDMSEDLEEVSTQDKVAALAAIAAAKKLKKRFSRKGRADAAEKKVKKQNDKEADKARLQKAKKELANKKKKKRLQKATDALRDAKTPAQKDDAKERITKIKKSMQEQRLIKVCAITLGEDFDETFIYEDVDFTKPSIIKEAYKKFIEENRAIVYNPKGIKRFIKQAEKKFPQYKGEIEQLEDDEIIFPNDPKLINFFKGAREVKFVLKDSVDLEEATELYKKGKITLTKFAMGKGKGAGLQINYGMKFIQIPEKEIKQLAQGITYVTKSVSQFKEDVDFTKPSAIKEAYEIFEVSADWIIYDRKTGKQLSPSKSWRKWQGAKMAAAKIGGDAEVSDKAWYHDNKAKLMGEASVELEEAVKFWTVTITKKAGKLFKGQTVDVKARNSAEAIKKGLKQMKADPNTVPSGSVDAVLGESIEESNKDKYMWGDINNAMSSSGLNPRVIMNVLSKLKGKAVK